MDIAAVMCKHTKLDSKFITIKISMNIQDRRILRIAIPAIVSNVTVPLLGLVDVAIVGHLGSAAYIGAIAVGGMVFNVMYWLFGFLRMGTSGMTSQKLGARDLCGSLQLMVRSVAIAVAIALCLVLFQRPILSLAFSLMQPTESVALYAATYFHILIWGAPAMLVQFSLTGWFIGMQNSRLPMVVAVVQNVVNIVASLCLVMLLGMKVEGVAFGTLIAQYAGLLISFMLWAAVYGRLKRHFLFDGLWRKSEIMRFLGVNRDIFLRTLCLVAVMLFFTSAGSWQGETILAVNTMLLQFYMIFSYFMDGFAYAGEALGGKAFGAGNKLLLSSTLRRIFIWGGMLTVLFTLLYGFGGMPFLSVLTNEQTVILAAEDYRFWILLLPVSGVAAFVWDGIYIGCTKTRGMLLSMFFAAITFFAVYFSLRYTLGNHALWLAFIAYMSVRGIVQTVIWKVS